MKLSKNFSIDELTHSDTAIRLGLDNSPTPEQLDCLQELVTYVLQPVRDQFGLVVISSGLRGEAVNKAVGGSLTSDHCHGRAADFEVVGVDNKAVAMWIAENLQFKQLILEFYDDGVTNSGWIHCSVDMSNNKKQKLTAQKDGKRTVYDVATF
tara:strand:+ start:585 stop:1043 length:459 start_codon:yes stop_codon:yes gene_type:complete